MGVLVKVTFMQNLQDPHEGMVILQNSTQDTLLHLHTLGREFLERIKLPIHGSTSTLFSSNRHLQHGRSLCR